MKCTIKNKTLKLNFKPRKIKNGLKIYFTRSVDEREMSDYPVATTNVKGTEYDISNIPDIVDIVRVDILQPTFLWFRKRWFKVEIV